MVVLCKTLCMDLFSGQYISVPHRIPEDNGAGEISVEPPQVSNNRPISQQTWQPQTQ